MQPDRGSAPADPEQLEMLEELIDRARKQGVRTGVRNDEIEDLTHPQAAELIEQLRQRLGDARG